jgi:hypothetical protein
MPIRDWSDSRERFAAPVEYWVLKIPDTQYWMMLRFSASSGSKYGLGAGAHPEKHQRLLELFHKIVASVKLEPITPIDLDRFLHGCDEGDARKVNMLLCLCALNTLAGALQSVFRQFIGHGAPRALSLIQSSRLRPVSGNYRLNGLGIGRVQCLSLVP